MLQPRPAWSSMAWPLLLVAVVLLQPSTGDPENLLNDRSGRFKRESNGGEEEGRGFLATKVMGNGVEVIVAGDRSTAPGAPSLRILPSIPTGLPITLAPSTLTDHMKMMLPHESQKPHNEFVTKTYLTTYTYMTTLSERGSTVVSSREQVVSNVATEEVRPSRTRPLEHVTLESSPHLTTGIYHTTYTYLNTLVDGQVPLVVTSKKTVTNTVTEPSNLLQPSEVPPLDTNTYLNTVAYTKTLSDGDQMKIVSTGDVLTQVVITESDYVPSTMDIKPTAIVKDVTKTYFVTYTYYSTLLEDGSTVVKSEVATSSDVVTEKFTIQPTRTQVQTSTDIAMDPTLVTGEDSSPTFNLHATKTYLTTFTYFTTLLQDNKTPSILVKSRTKVVQNVVTETVDTSMLDASYLSLLRTSLSSEQNKMASSAALVQKIDVTPVDTTIKPTSSVSLSSSLDETPLSNVIKGSTIIFFDDDDDATLGGSPTSQTPELTPTSQAAFTTKASQSISPSNAMVPKPFTKVTDQEGSPSEKLPGGFLDLASSENHVSNLFQIGALGINGLSALGPVINAMAGLINNNLSADKKKNETYVPPLRPDQVVPYRKEPVTPTIRAPIYIPVGGLAASDSEPSESQNVEGHNAFPEGGERVKPFAIVGRPNIEAAMLTGGIPISPGQVITTNSDIIIGKPAVHGPRPPVKTPHRKDEVEGMKPPPPPNKPNWPIRDQSRYPSVLVPHRVPPNDDQFKHIPPQIRDHYKPVKEHDYPQKHEYQTPQKHEYQPPQKHEYQPPQKHHPTHNKNGNHHSENFDNEHRPTDNIPHIHPHRVNDDKRIVNGHGPLYHQSGFQGDDKKKLNYANNGINPAHLHNQPHRQQVSPQGHKRPESHESHYIRGDQTKPMKHEHDLSHQNYPFYQLPTKIHLDETSDLRPPSVHQSPSAENFRPESNNIPKIPTVNIPIIKAPILTETIQMGHENPNLYEKDSVVVGEKGVGEAPANHPLLVDIQPSQVANVIIPHGSATALVYKEEPDQHSQKGEIFNEPSAYPDAEVGMLGVAGLTTSHLHQHVPSNAVRMDVQVSPHLITVDPQQNSNFNIPSGFRRPEPGVVHGSHHPRPVQHGGPPGQINMAYLSPPPPPPGSTPQSHFSEESLEESDDYSYNDQIETEGGEVIQESKTRPLRPGQLPVELINRQQTSMPIDIKDEKITYTSPKPSVFNFTQNNGDIKYSVVNSKPVKLDSQNLNINQPPIINGKPVVSPFVDSSQATVSIGHKTNLKPNTNEQRPTNLPKISNEQTNEIRIIKKPTLIENKDYGKGSNTSQVKPFDNTVVTMNMDERPPPPTFETVVQSYERPAPQNSSPRPFSPSNAAASYDRNSHDDRVVGLSPPPPVTRSPPQEETTHVNLRRPAPARKRPPPPYKFEIPPPLEPRPVKPIFLEAERPPPPPVPTELLSPPKPVEEYFKKHKKPPTTERPDHKKIFSATTPVTAINPVLGGSLKVEELPQKPEVITAESKVVMNNVVNGRPGGTHVKLKPGVHAMYSGKPVAEISPSKARLPPVTSTWVNSVLVGSETEVEESKSTTSTETLHDDTSKLLSSGTTTIFGNLFTRPSTTEKFTPTRVSENYYHSISVVVDPLDNKNGENVISEKPITESESGNSLGGRIVPKDNLTPTEFVVTHTKTLTVTTTESTVIHKDGGQPSTHTVILTKTMTSTVLDTVTEIHTLVKPTSILSTVTTTVSQIATSLVYPANNPPYETDDIIGTSKEPSKLPEENDSILVVMNDKNSGDKAVPHLPIDDTIDIEGPSHETNEVNPNVLLGGLLSHHQDLSSECQPECKATRNELCQKINNVMRCVCRPGFARMFPDRPCKPTYTYSLSLPLERYGKEKIWYSPNLQDSKSEAFHSLSEMTKEALDRMAMQSDLRDIYHGIAVTGFSTDLNHEDTAVNFYVQLSENTEESKLRDVLRKHLRTSNYSLGGTEIFASKEKLQQLTAEDFDECSDNTFHDCSEHAQCFNLRGTYTCSCKEGYTDLSHNTLYPGRICSADVIGCSRCNFHGTCYSRSEDEEMCECFQWYAGQYCQINLKVLLLILVLIGASLIVLLIVCLLMSCMRRRPHMGTPPTLRPPGFRPRTLQSDKRAMISIDTSSEASIDNTPPPYIKQAVMSVQRPKPIRKQSKAPSPPMSLHGTMEQRDRSLTVMIPRAKYRPVPVQSNSNLLTMSTFGPEQKLLTYLTAEKPSSKNTSRKPSNSTNHSVESIHKKPHLSPIRKPSTGALVSAGFEVSATVGRTKELEEGFLSEPHTDLGQHAFSTIRTAERTVSEARSYDETTIHPPTKCIRGHYDKHQHCNDEGNTMVERDVGSTFVMPQSHLYKPDNCQGSDISNFDSL